jgi:predicted DNA-binding protein (MmcQ/YjbR family)
MTREPAERIKSPQELAILARLRAICAELPEVAEAVDGFGHTSFRVTRKPFCMMGSQELHLAIKSDPVTQEILVKSGRYRRTPFLGQHGWVSVVDFERLDWDELEELVRDGYRLAAPKRLLKRLEERE